MYLIVGGDSKIGRAISNSWSNRVLFHSSTRVKNLESSTRPYIDLSDIDSININHSYRVIVVAAGVTSIQECEDNPEKTRLINVVNTSLLVNKLCRNGALVVFLSSNQVFDGNLPYRKATDSKNPISEYGKQKSETEDLLLSNCDNVSILRMTKVVDNEFA